MSAESLVLSSTYPRRELTVDMEDTTLVQLGLAPSGVVIVRLNRVRITYNPRPLSQTCTCMYRYNPRPVTSIPGLSHIIPGLSHIIPGLSHTYTCMYPRTVTSIPGPSHTIPGLSLTNPGLTLTIPGLPCPTRIQSQVPLTYYPRPHFLSSKSTPCVYTLLFVLRQGSSTGSGKEGSPSSLWGIILSLFQLLMSVVTLVKRLCGWGGGEETAQQNATNTRSVEAVLSQPPLT